MASKTTYLAQFHENQCFFPDGKNVSQMIIFYGMALTQCMTLND